jgi:hypothetical protein
MKILKTTGLVIFGSGALSLIGYWLYLMTKEFLWVSDIPFIIRFGVIAIILGIIVTLIALIFERINDKKNENLDV